MPNGASDAAPGGETQPSNLNIANALTVLRILMVPVFGWLLLVDDGESTGYRLAAFAVFVLAMATDRIDGDLARSRGLITDFGKIADPIADKAITGMAFIGLSIVGDIWWWVTVVVLLREWSVTLLRLSVLKQVVIPAAQSGKIKTVLQAFALAGLTWPLPHGDAHGGAFDFWPGPLGEALFYLSQVMLAGAVVMTMWSGWEFVREVRRQRVHPA